MEAAKKTIQEEIEEEIRSLATGIELLRLLGNPLPSEGIQRTKDKQTYKGYDTDGYISQFCTNRFNEVLGTEWGVVWEILNQEKGSTSKGKPCWEITVKIGIWVLRREDTRWHSGGHVSKTHFDALKGAVTNGFKKAAALWGVGRHAFEGALDDDNDPWPEWVAQNGSGPDADAIAKDFMAPPAGQQAQPPKQTDQHGQQAQPKNNSNAPESGQQNGPNSPASSPSSPAGNGKEAGLRRRIIAKLETIFGRSEEMINAWLDRNFGIKNGEGLSNLHADILEKILDKVEEKFKDWKNSKNN